MFTIEIKDWHEAPWKPSFFFIWEVKLNVKLCIQPKMFNGIYPEIEKFQNSWLFFWSKLKIFYAFGHIMVITL